MDIDEFLRWCAQFREFKYGSVSYWVDAFKRGDGLDMYGHRIELMDGRTLKTRART
jgi:hypothetical protein